MVQEIVRANCGILFDYDAFERWGIPITIGKDISPSHIAGCRPGKREWQWHGQRGAVAEYQADAVDVMQPMHDQLRKNPFWWILEIPFTSYTYQNEKDKWVTKWR
jgi:hypothetical protein